MLFSYADGLYSVETSLLKSTGNQAMNNSSNLTVTIDRSLAAHAAIMTFLGLA